MKNEAFLSTEKSSWEKSTPNQSIVQFFGLVWAQIALNCILASNRPESFFASEPRKFALSQFSMCAVSCFYFVILAEEKHFAFWRSLQNTWMDLFFDESAA